MCGCVVDGKCTVPIMFLFAYSDVCIDQHCSPCPYHAVMTPAPVLTMNCTTLYNSYNGHAIIGLRWEIQGDGNQLAAIRGYEVVTTVISMAAAEGIFFIVQPIALDVLPSNVSHPLNAS